MNTHHIPASLKRQIIASAKGRCAYCLSEEKMMGVTFEIDHIIPRHQGGHTTIENLCLSCPSCNRYRTTKTHATDPITGLSIPIFHPVNDLWHEHFLLDTKNARIRGLTPVGRTTISALKMNRLQMIAIHNVVAAASATAGLLGQEGNTLRKTIIPTLYYVLMVGLIGLLAINLFEISDPLLAYWKDIVP